jgi:hypothetical protein
MQSVRKSGNRIAKVVPFAVPDLPFTVPPYAQIFSRMMNRPPPQRITPIDRGDDIFRPLQNRGRFAQNTFDRLMTFALAGCRYLPNCRSRACVAGTFDSRINKV